MSATLGTLLSELQPDWKIVVYERLHDVGLESSNAWNNAGTGHAALCELNYTPEAKDGTVDPAKAISINEQFQQSRQFWSTLVEEGVLDAPSTFINSAPHMTFVRGEKDVAFLKKRYEALKEQPLFAGIQYSEDSRVINTLGAAAHAEAPQGRAVRRDARPRRHRRRLRRPHPPALRQPQRARRRGRAPTARSEASSGRPTARGASKWRNSIGRTPGAIRRAVRLRRRRWLGAQAPAELRHPRDLGLRRLPHRRAVPQDHQPGARRPAQGEGLLAGLGRRPADVGPAPRHPRGRRRGLAAVRAVRDVQPQVPQERLDVRHRRRRCAPATSGR